MPDAFWALPCWLLSSAISYALVSLLCSMIYKKMTSPRAGHSIHRSRPAYEGQSRHLSESKETLSFPSRCSGYMLPSVGLLSNFVAFIAFKQEKRSSRRRPRPCHQRRVRLPLSGLKLCGPGGGGDRHGAPQPFGLSPAAPK